MIQLLKNPCTTFVTAMFRIDPQQVENVALKLLKRRIVGRHTLNVNILGKPFSAYAYTKLLHTGYHTVTNAKIKTLTGFQIDQF